MRIRWILSNTGVTPGSAALESSLASYRYRAQIPMRELRARGHRCDWIALDSAGTPAAAHRALDDADVLIFAKNHTEPDAVLALVSQARQRGIATIADVCDDYFADAHELSPYYRELVGRADVVTASSFQLAGAIEDATSAEAHVVRDPYEGPAAAPRWAPEGTHVKGLWFGTPVNLQALLDEALTLPERIDGYYLDVVTLTRHCEGLEEGLDRLNARSPETLALRFREWTLERNWRELHACDLVLIPVRANDRFALAKGPNRLVEALRAGRFAVAGALPAYVEFRDYAWVGDDLAAGITWARAHPAEVAAKIAAGQAYIDREYSPHAAASEWEAALSAAMERAA
jgi:hypothetical protein